MQWALSAYKNNNDASSAYIEAAQNLYCTAMEDGSGYGRRSGVCLYDGLVWKTDRSYPQTLDAGRSDKHVSSTFQGNRERKICQ